MNVKLQIDELNEILLEFSFNMEWLQAMEMAQAYLSHKWISEELADLAKGAGGACLTSMDADGFNVWIAVIGRGDVAMLERRKIREALQ